MASIRPASLWRCPRCRAELVEEAESLRCAGCGAVYPVIAGIPDLRIDAPAWLNCAEDREQALQVAAASAELELRDLVHLVFSSVRGQPPDGAVRRTREVMAAPARLRREIRGWLDEPTARGPFLDLGCGPGMLLGAGFAEGRAGIGIDVSMVWLVVAKRLIEDAGGTPILAAGFAEALPLADGAVQAVVSLDVIEHVGDQRAYLREIDRVTAVGGMIALATPNRFSLAPEPHVHVWGVGWLPRPFQLRYAEARSGLSYAFTRLLSTPETKRLIRAETTFAVTLVVPELSAEDFVYGPRARRALARIYNWLIRTPGGRQLALAVGPFFRVVGRKGANRTRKTSGRSTS